MEKRCLICGSVISSTEVNHCDVCHTNFVEWEIEEMNNNPEAYYDRVKEATKLVTIGRYKDIYEKRGHLPIARMSFETAIEMANSLSKNVSEINVKTVERDGKLYNTVVASDAEVELINNELKHATPTRYIETDDGTLRAKERVLAMTKVPLEDNLTFKQRLVNINRARKFQNKWNKNAKLIRNTRKENVIAAIKEVEELKRLEAKEQRQIVNQQRMLNLKGKVLKTVKYFSRTESIKRMQKKVALSELKNQMLVAKMEVKARKLEEKRKKHNLKLELKAMKANIKEQSKSFKVKALQKATDLKTEMIEKTNNSLNKYAKAVEAYKAEMVA